MRFSADIFIFERTVCLSRKTAKKENRTSKSGTMNKKLLRAYDQAQSYYCYKFRKVNVAAYHKKY